MEAQTASHSWDKTYYMIGRTSSGVLYGQKRGSPHLIRVHLIIVLHGGNMDINSLSPEDHARLPKGKIVVVYGFVLGFLPNTVIAVRQGDDWFLPGGAVEGPGTPAGTDDGQHFRALASHVTDSPPSSQASPAVMLTVLSPHITGVQSASQSADSPSSSQLSPSALSVTPSPQYGARVQSLLQPS